MGGICPVRPLVRAELNYVVNITVVQRRGPSRTRAVSAGGVLEEGRIRVPAIFCPSVCLSVRPSIHLM